MHTKSFNQQMLDIVDLFLKSGGCEPIDSEELAKFAISKGLWMKSESQLIQQCKRDFSRAFREQYHRDEQGREVRTYHAVKFSSGPKQQVFWADMRSATRDHMNEAVSQRRKHILGECWQLKQDVDSYNENVNKEQPLPLFLNFEEDIREREQSTTYEG